MRDRDRQDRNREGAAGEKRRRAPALIGTVLATLFAALALFPLSASAEIVVATSGEGADQVRRPLGLAVDTTSKLLYAADFENERVDVWNAETGAFIQAFGWGVLDGTAAFQECATSCRRGISGPGVGQFDNIRAVAVDNDPASTSYHSVYVAETGIPAPNTSNNRIQKFDADGDFVLAFGDGVNKTTGGDVCTAASGHECGAGVGGEGVGQFNGIGGVAVGPGGVVYVADRVGEGSAAKTRVQRFSPEGVLLGEIQLSVTGGAGGTVGLALDSGGNYLVATDALLFTGAVRKYDPAGNLLWTRHESFNIAAVATDPADNVYVTDGTGEISSISQYDSSGTLLRVFYGSLRPGTNATSLAFFENSNGDLFAGEARVNGLDGRVLHVDVPPVGPVVRSGSNFVNPISNVKATLHSEINPEGKETTYHFEYVDAESFAEDGWSSPNVVSTTESETIGSDFDLHKVEQQITGLTPETVYHYRVVATNADASNAGEESTFETAPPLGFGEIWSADVDTDSATLHGEANPFGFPATGYFEYVDDATYQVSGFDDAAKAPTGAPIDFGGGESLVEGSASIVGLQPATTYHYRLVAEDNCKPAEPTVVCTFTSDERVGDRVFRTFSPPATVTGCPNDPFRPDAGAYLPDCRGYEMVSPVDKNGVNAEVVFNEVGYRAGLDQADPTGEKITYSAYRAFADPEGSPYTSQYLATRSAQGWAGESIALPREGPTLFHGEGLDSQFKAFTADLCFGWPLQDTARPLLAPGAIDGYSNLYRRDNCPPEAGAYSEVTTGTPVGVAEPRLFYPALQGFSADGSKAFFSVKAKLTPDAPVGSAQVYEAQGGTLNPVCVLPGGTVTSGGCSLGTGNGFGVERNANVANAVSDDGSVVYWTEDAENPDQMYVRVNGLNTYPASTAGQLAQFWTAAADGSKAVYSAGDKLFLFDLASKAPAAIASGGVLGVAGASEDASQIYFVSTKALAAGATAGKFNLFRYDDGALHFIGALASADFLASKPSPTANRPILRVARVTPDGNHLVFMSKASLTGYDNKDAVTKEPASEVFLYDATANGGAGQLRCVSCNPTGARPVGRAWSIAEIIGGRAASWIPGWTNQLYAPRVVSDDGSRVFFNSFDRLVARDTDAKQDVYEWELAGAGDCTASAPLYSAPAGGCISLISSGQSEQDSEFVDSSASGDDVFFKTYSSLVGQDPGLLDLYDARVQGGFAAPVPEGPECAGEACQPPAPPAPAPPPAPRSSTFLGPGNPPPVKPRPRCPKGKHRAKRKGRVVCVKNRRAGKAAKQRRAGR